MNSFSHALPYLDLPYVAVGCSLPDWLGAVDRKVRVRERAATPFLKADDQRTNELVRGIIQHHQDDRWFHQTETFVQLSLQFSVEIRERLEDPVSFRPGLLGHILIELMLDAYLQTSRPGTLARYYDQVRSVDPTFVQSVVNTISKRSTTKLVKYFELFLAERYIFDYVDDQRMMYRMNRVLGRVRLPPVQNELWDWLPSARQRVYSQAERLLPRRVIDA